MKRLLVLLCIAALLWGCAPVDGPETEPILSTPTEATETIPAATQMTEPIPHETQPPQTDPPETVPTDPVPEVDFPYTQFLHAAVGIYGAPSYDEVCLRVVEEDGMYTIVEEVTDAEGNCWGRLKSGAGWVDLSALDLSVPVTAAYADERLLISGNYHPYTGETSDYITKVAFRARENLTDVQLSALEPDWERGDGYTLERPLYIIPALEPGMPLVAELAFLGDMTAYGLSFTDSTGAVRHFAVTVSGRNGDLVINEYIPG